MKTNTRNDKRVIIDAINEVVRWRVGASIAWSVLLLPATFAIYNIVAVANLFDVRQWLYDAVIPVFSLTTIGAFLWLCFVVGVTNYYTSTLWTVRPSSGVRSGWHIATVLLYTPSHVVSLIAYSIAACVLASALLATSDAASSKRFAHWTASCGPAANQWCINEYRFILAGFGTAVGFTFCLSSLLCQKNCLAFPVVTQPKFFRCKASMMNHLRASLQLSWFVLRVYFVAYLLIGSFFRMWLASILLVDDSARSASSTAAPQDSHLWILMDVSLAWQLFVCGVFITFNFELSRTLLHIYLTERYNFPVEVDFEEETTMTLASALYSSEHPYVQYMAFLDLCFLSRHDPERRQQLFTLSQPGGHPHRWRQVCTATLSVIEDLCSQLRSHVAAASMSVAAASVTIKGGDVTAQLKQPLQATKDASRQTATGLEKERGSLVLAAIRSHPLFSFITKEFVDGACGQLFADSQKHIWAVEGLAELTVASYTEDEYGAVQVTLVDVIVALLNLLEAIEKFLKASPSLPRKPTTELFNSRSLELLLKLKLSVRTALYRIASIFGQHISYLHLSEDHQTKLKQFAEYRE